MKQDYFLLKLFLLLELIYVSDVLNLNLENEYEYLENVPQKYPFDATGDFSFFCIFLFCFFINLKTNYIKHQWQVEILIFALYTLKVFQLKMAKNDICQFFFYLYLSIMQNILFRYHLSTAGCLYVCVFVLSIVYTRFSLQLCIFSITFLM